MCDSGTHPLVKLRAAEEKAASLSSFRTWSAKDVLRRVTLPPPPPPPPPSQPSALTLPYPSYPSPSLSPFSMFAFPTLLFLQGFVLFGWVFRLPPPVSDQTFSASSTCGSQMPLILLGALSGLLGSILDSLLGAVLQASYFDT